MQLPGREAVLIDLSDSEYNALNKLSDETKVSMTQIVRDLIRDNLMKEPFLSGLSLSKRIVQFAEEDEGRTPIVVHLLKKEHDFLKKMSDRKSETVTEIVRNLIRKYVVMTPRRKAGACESPIQPTVVSHDQHEQDDLTIVKLR